MYYRYQPYPYHRRYYNLDPYYYRKYYYNPYCNYQRNIIGSQVADVNQSINNFGNMTDVIQDSNVYQSMAPASEFVGICTELPPIEPMTIHLT